MSLGPVEIVAIVLMILLLFGYKKLPDASRSLGRSLRIFKGEMKGMKDDARADDAAQTSPPLRGEIAPPTTIASDDVTPQPNEEAWLAEARRAEAQRRADQSRGTDGPH